MNHGQKSAVISALDVKAKALELGADLVGIASAKVLNAFPPDPRYPQTPDRISPRVKSVVVIVQHIPAAGFRCKQMVPVQYLDMIVLRRMDKIAARIAYWLEEQGHPAFVTAAQETDWNMKKASYGYLSTRHLGIEAGLGVRGAAVGLLWDFHSGKMHNSETVPSGGLSGEGAAARKAAATSPDARLLPAESGHAVPPQEAMQACWTDRASRGSFLSSQYITMIVVLAILVLTRYPLPRIFQGHVGCLGDRVVHLL